METCRHLVVGYEARLGELRQQTRQLRLIRWLLKHHDDCLLHALVVKERHLQAAQAAARLFHILAPDVFLEQSVHACLCCIDISSCSRAPASKQPLRRVPAIDVALDTDQDSLHVRLVICGPTILLIETCLRLPLRSDLLNKTGRQYVVDHGAGNEQTQHLHRLGMVQ